MKKLSVVAVLIACVSWALVAAAPNQGGTLVNGLPGDVGLVDPAFCYDFTTSQVVAQVTEGLLYFDDQMEPQPLLAESWEHPDLLTYIFHIRKGVTFSDGTPMTVDDVIFSLERIRNPDTASQLGWVYENVDTIEQVDDWTVRISLSAPDAFFGHAMATAAGHIISKDYFEANEEKFGRPDAPLLGTGAFKISSWTSGIEIVLERNENYWDQANPPSLDKVVFNILPNETTRLAALKTGEIHMTLGPGSIPIDQFPVVEAIETVRLFKAISFQAEYMVFNTQREPFDDRRVRQAIYHALDKEQIYKALFNSEGVKAKPTLITPSMWTFEHETFQEAYDALPEYPYDLEKAKQLLAQTNVPDGFEATITTDSDPVRRNLALALQDAVKPLGIELDIEEVTWTELVERLQFTLDYDMAMDSWASDFPDPAGNLYPTHLSTNIGQGGANQSLYVNKKVDELVLEQNRTTDNAKRADLMIQAQALIAEDAPEIVFNYPPLVMALNKEIAGYHLTPMWLWQAWAKDMYKVE